MIRKRKGTLGKERGRKRAGCHPLAQFFPLLSSFDRTSPSLRAAVAGVPDTGQVPLHVNAPASVSLPDTHPSILAHAA